MKRVLVVFDSLYGNTEKVANAISESIGSQARVTTLRIGAFNPAEMAEVDLLVIGSPTQGFQPTKAVGEALRRLKGKGVRGLRAAAFDTRFGEVRLKSGALRLLVKTGGFAAPRMARALEKAGATLLAPPEGFFVEDTEGPLEAGELERAGAWGNGLLQYLG